MQQKKQSDNTVVIEKNLLDVVQKMFKRCFDANQYHQAIGISIESMRLDVLEEAITKGDATGSLLNYVLESAMSIIQNLKFRNQVYYLL